MPREKPPTADVEPAGPEPLEPNVDSTSQTVTHTQNSGGWQGKPVAPAAPYMTLLGRFDLVRPIGMGISGAVFEAVDRSTAQRVALKLLHRCEPSDLYRIKAEFRALAELAHPNLVAMHELFVDDKQRGFFTMELIQGEPFVQYVRTNAEHDPAAAEQRLRACLEQLARGVLFLHAHGMLHRDLKPSNILVDPRSGRVTIVDFGLVKSLTDRTDRADRNERSDTAQPTDDPRFEGTPAYAAPEQLDSHASEFASDWYAIGVMLYEALVGRRPFAATESGLRDRRLHDPPPLEAAGRLTFGRELEAVCLQLLARDPKQRAGGRELLAALGSAEQVRVAEPAPDFIGREAELQELERAFERALHGSAGPGALVISGQSGMGKTSLAHAFLDHLHASGRARALRGRCYVQEALRYNAFDGILDALSNHLRQRSADELAQLLPRDVVALAQVFPVLRRIGVVDRLCAATPTSERSDARADAFAALRKLLASLAERTPLVLFIDDLQWTDADSTRLLQELLSPPIPAVWLLATERSDAAPDGGTLGRVGAGGLVVRLSLGPLSEGAVAALAQRLIDGCRDERAAEIARRSGGHPMFASELIRYARSDGGSLASLALEAALSARLITLTSEAKALLELVCLAGQRLPQSLLSDQSGAPPLAALRELRVAAAIRDSLVDEEQHVEAYHDRIRELVVSALPEPRRQAVHSQLAERMRARGSMYLERVIQRYVLAGREREAAMLAEEAAQQAGRGLAFHSAAELLELALRHAQAPEERRRLRLAAAEACAQAGRALAAADHCERAAEEADDPSERAELLLRAGTGYWAAGHGKRGREILVRLSRDLGVPLEVTAIKRSHAVALIWLMLAARTPFLRTTEPPHGGSRALAHSGAAEPSLRMIWRIAPSLLIVDPHEGTYFVARAFELAAEQGNRVVYAQSLAVSLCVAAFMTRAPSWLIELHFARAHRLVEEGDFWDKAFVLVMEAGATFFRAQDVRTVGLLRDAANMTQLGSSFASCVRNWSRTGVMLGLHWLGRLTELRELSEAWTKDALDCGERQMQVTARVMGLHAHLGRDDVPRALEEIELARRVDLDHSHVLQDLEPWWVASVHLYRGRPEEALALLERKRANRALYSDFNPQSGIMWVLTEGTCAAALAVRGQDLEQSLALLERSAKRARWTFSKRATPIAAQLTASLALLRGRRGEATAGVRRAVAGYDALGSKLYAASLRLALARLDSRRSSLHEARALATFAEEGVTNPKRFAYMIAPGLLPEPE